MRYLIAGASGQLARAFIDRLQTGSHQLFAPSEAELDISDAEKVSQQLADIRPDVVLNCAAYNQVDAAEGEGRDVAFAVNCDGPAHLARASRAQGALLVHYGTDYVFDGRGEKLYSEDDEPAPTNVYGQSKLDGERAVMDSGCDYLLFRVSWVFGAGTQNFMYKLDSWSRRPGPLKVVCDQLAVPTYTEDIVTATVAAIDRDLRGLYHLVNSGSYASRYEVARFFVDQLPSEHPGCGSLVLPVSSDAFETAARRPYFSALSAQRLEKALDMTLPSWQDAVRRYVMNIREHEE